MDLFRVAVVQAGSVPFNRERSTTKALDLTDQAIRSGARLIVFPEAFISGYPKGIDFGARVGMRSPQGRKWFRTYFESAITVPGPEVDQLTSAARDGGVHVVIGVIESDGGTLYCTASSARFAQTSQADADRHERLIWGFGDGTTLPVLTHPPENGAIICWEKNSALVARAIWVGYQILRPYGRPPD
jgi:nitrilase